MTLLYRFRSSLTYFDDVGQRRALRRTLGPPPAGRRETPLQREALPHKDAILNTRAYFRNRVLSHRL